MSLLAMSSAESFEDAVVSAISLGGDTDTVGAMVGAMAGACWGVEGIPSDWVKGIANSEALIHRATKLSELTLSQNREEQIEAWDEEGVDLSLDSLIDMELDVKESTP